MAAIRKYLLFALVLIVLSSCKLEFDPSDNGAILEPSLGFECMDFCTFDTPEDFAGNYVATPAPNYRFSDWSGDACNSPKRRQETVCPAIVNPALAALDLTQPFGRVSRDSLASLVAGKEVRVESDKNDRYGRTLGKVWVQPADCPTCGKTLNANHAQLLAGMAWWYRYYAKELSPEDRARYESAEDEAKARGRGLWADPSPINPYRWRKGGR
jgi:endonuclease YncB( thermonuclease family)